MFWFCQNSVSGQNSIFFIYRGDPLHVLPTVPAFVNSQRRKIFTNGLVDSNDRAVSLNTGMNPIFRSAGFHGER